VDLSFWLSIKPVWEGFVSTTYWK